MERIFVMDKFGKGTRLDENVECVEVNVLGIIAQDVFKLQRNKEQRKKNEQH